MRPAIPASEEGRPRPRSDPPGLDQESAHATLVCRRARVSPGRNADHATLAGRSDAALAGRTGRTWARWVRALDRVQAYTWSHGEIVEHLGEEYGLTGWWSQCVTVGYERIKGLRALGQRRDGSFEASKSRTFGVPLVRLYRAFHDSRARARWLPDVPLVIRTATRGKSMRVTWPDRTSVAIGFASRGAGKSQVALLHGKLPDRAAAARMKRYWGERFDALGELLSSE